MRERVPILPRAIGGADPDRGHGLFEASDVVQGCAVVIRTGGTSGTGRPAAAAAALAVALGAATGCERAWRHGFIDPTQIGRFDEKSIRNEIRHTLGPLEEPSGIPGAVEPTREDLVASFEELALGRGDVVDFSILDLLQVGQPTEVRRQVNDVGYVTLPVIGPMKVIGLTPRQVELEIMDVLRTRQILQDPEIAVVVFQSLSRRYSALGNVQRPGDYPLLRGDYRLLEAIAAIGPISVMQKKVYVMRGGTPRGYVPPAAEAPFQKPGDAPPTNGQREFEDPFSLPENGELAPSLSDVGSGGWPAPSAPESNFLESPTQPAPLPGRGGPVSGAGGPASGPTHGPTHRDFLEALRPEGQDLGELESLTTRRAPATKFIFLNGEWVEVAETQPGDGSGARRPGQPATGEGVDWEKLSEAETPLRVLEIPVEALMKGDMRYNIVVRPNDLINVPSEHDGEYYVMGHVARPGAYSLRGDTTVKEAVAAAGGLSLLAWPSRCELIRRLSGDQEEIRLLNLDRIFSGEEPDFFLRPNDILNVGTHAMAPFLATVRNSFRLSYGFGFVYDRNFADEDSFFAQEQIRARRRAERIQRGFPP